MNKENPAGDGEVLRSGLAPALLLALAGLLARLLLTGLARSVTMLLALARLLARLARPIAVLVLLARPVPVLVLLARLLLVLPGILLLLWIRHMSDSMGVIARTTGHYCPTYG